MRFTLEPRCWYAVQFIGDEFEQGLDGYQYSPIRVDGIHLHKGGNRTFDLDFFHANYPQGVNNKQYKLVTIERGREYLLARSMDHDPLRILKIGNISATWLREKLNKNVPDGMSVSNWLDRNS